MGNNTKATTKDTIVSQIPQHIVEKYPNFVLFLESYYEWLNTEGNPYQRIKDHMDYTSFEKSMEAYTNLMLSEYLNGIPTNIDADKELLIEWSRKLNLARGSHESFKLLFKILFREHDVDIYLPKDNILRTSDGRWIANQSVMLVTNPGDPESLLYRRIRQQKQILPGIFETAEATVESIQVSYAGRYNVVHLILVDIVGEFEDNFPIDVIGLDGVSVWPIRTVVDFVINEGGTNYFQNEHIRFEGLQNNYVVESVIANTGVFDTRITTTFTAAEVKVEVDGVEIFDFSYDGQFVRSPQLVAGRDIKFTIDEIYLGTMKIGRVGADGSVESMFVEVPSIGITDDLIPVSYEIVEYNVFDEGYIEDSYGDKTTTKLKSIGVQNKLVEVYKAYSYSARYYDAELPPPTTTSIGHGTGLIAYAVTGVVRKIPGFYMNTRGWLSSNMYLQDNLYYQEYSYEVRSAQEFSKYEQLVKELLHPSGFMLFGHVNSYVPLNARASVNELGSGHFVN